MLREETRASKDIPLSPWRKRIHTVIFEADTPAGKLFDILLLIAIAISTVAVMLESVKEINRDWKYELRVLEWVITVFFTLEYIARIISVQNPLKYIFSFYGIIDLLSILPTFAGMFIADASTLRVIRVIRLLRIFRIFKLGRYIREAEMLRKALSASRWKIIVFFGVIISICIIIGTLMYIIEGDHSREGGNGGFTSIPRSIYWAIVTMTTVGYGDISPTTPLGQTLSSFIMLLGYAILAVPTGIVSVEFGTEIKNRTVQNIHDVSGKACDNCSKEGHDTDALYCKYCGGTL